MKRSARDLWDVTTPGAVKSLLIFLVASGMFGLCFQSYAKTEADKEAINRQLAESIETTQKDIKKATKELNDLRDKMSDKRVPLAFEMEKLQADVISLRRDAQRLLGRLRQRRRSGPPPGELRDPALQVAEPERPLPQQRRWHVLQEKQDLGPG